MRQNVIRNLVSYLVGAIGVAVFLVCALASIPTATTTEAAMTPAAQRANTGGMFYPTTKLDTAQIDNLRTWVALLPEGYSAETTPMVPVADRGVLVPEESPEGGYVLPSSQWLDNSPLYDDGWLLLVDDTHHTVTWRAPQSESSADQYGAGNGAVCGPDAQCRQYDHDHGVTDHDLPCSATDPHDAGKC